MRKQYHQLEPRSISRAALDKAHYRHEVKGEKYEEDAIYLDPNYPGEFFVWHPWTAEEKKLPGNHGSKGEWRMGAIAGGE